jgi:hypothetical protein
VGWGLTAISEHHGIRGHEVQSDAADAQAGEHDASVWIGVEGAERGVTLCGGHAPVDARVRVAGVVELTLDDVEEGGPLGEDDDLGAVVLERGLEDLEEGLGLGALGVLVEVLLVVRRRLGRRLEELVFGQCGAAHGALGLHFDDFCDAAAAEDVLAVRDDGVDHVLHADGALFLALDDELEGLLEEDAVLVGERDDVLVLEERE